MTDRPLPGCEERTALALLIDDLRVTEVGDGEFRGPILHRNLPRMFGGQVLGQAMMAAGARSPVGRLPHSMHCYFLSPGDPAVPVDYRVVVLRDGGAFSVRRVDAHQGDKLLATISLSFHRLEKSLEHDTRRIPVIDPLTVPTLKERLHPVLATLPPWWTDPLPFDLRFVDDPVALAGGPARAARQEFWFTANGEIPDEPVLHAALLAYVSDLNLLDAALLPHAGSWYGTGKINGASVDHAMWFHEAPRLDQWLHCTQVSPRAHNGRTFCTAEIRSLSGTLMTSASQEGLLRIPTQSPTIRT